MGVTLLLLILAAASCATADDRGPVERYWDDRVYGIVDDVRNNIRPSLSQYPPTIVDKISSMMDAVGGNYHVAVWGNEIHTHCTTDGGCWFRYRYDIHQHDYDVSYHGVKYTLAIFQKGWFTKCGQPGGSQNWWFTFDEDTICKDASRNTMPCSNYGKCFIEWDCPNLTCITEDN